MKISVMQARAIAEAMTKGADDAMAHGKHEFDVTAIVRSIDEKALDKLQGAIEAARNAGA